MKQSKSEFLESIGQLPPPEKAAAVVHRVYMLTASRTGWPTRTPETWAELDDQARAYNVESIHTWIEERELFAEFVDAIAEARLGAKKER
jgi:hypothetical protein